MRKAPIPASQDSLTKFLVCGPDHNILTCTVCVYRMILKYVYMYENRDYTLILTIIYYRKDCYSVYIMDVNRLNKPYNSIFTNVLQYMMPHQYVLYFPCSRTSLLS